jgi:hypothetical protein
MYQKYLLPNTVFTILWSTIGILSIVVDIGLLVPSNRIHIYALLAICTFNITYFFCTKKKDLLSPIEKIDTVAYKINDKFVYLINIIALGLISPNFIASLKTILTVGLDLTYVRNQSYILQRFDNPILIFLFRSVPMALFATIMLITVYNIASGNKKFLYITLFNLVIVTLTFGGRSTLWDFMSYFIGALITTSNLIKVRIKKRKYLVYAAVAMVIVTLLRGQDIMNVVKSAQMYFVGSFSYLELIIRNPLQFGLLQAPMYGYLTLGFIFEPLVLVIKLLTGANIDVPSYYFNIYAQGFVNIGETKSILYNNNTTMLYTFLCDFGTVGVVIGTFFVAWLICYLQKKAIKGDKLRSKLLLIFMYAVIFDSARVYILSSTTPLIILLTLLFVVRKQRKTNATRLYNRSRVVHNLKENKL